MAENWASVLLPGRYIPADIKPKQLLDVFVYRDSEDRLVATTEIPRYGQQCHHDEMVPLLDGRGHGVGHGQLFIAMFVVRQSRGDAASGPQDFKADGVIQVSPSTGGEKREGARRRELAFSRFAGMV